MAEVKWIKITTNIFDDEKIKIIDTMPARDEIIVIWFKLLALAGKVNKNGLLFMSDKIPYTSEMLSAIFNRKEATVKLALATFENFGMIDVEDNEVISISNWEKHQNIDGMAKIREQNRLRVAKHREKKQQLLANNNNCNVTSNVTETKSNAIELELELDIDKDNNNGDLENHQELNLEEVFEEMWKLFPRKKGKGQVNKKAKQWMYKNQEECKRCISRFVRDMQKENRSIETYPYGSTFFNSGYIDYTDSEYTEDIAVKQGEDKQEMTAEEQEKKRRYEQTMRKIKEGKV